MPIGPYNSSSLSGLASQTNITEQTNRHSAFENDNRTSNYQNSQTSNSQNTVSQSFRPIEAGNIDNTYSVASIPGLTPAQHLNQAIERVSNLVQQQTNDQLTSGYQNPGTYLSILV